MKDESRRVLETTISQIYRILLEYHVPSYATDLDISVHAEVAGSECTVEFRTGSGDLPFSTLFIPVASVPKGASPGETMKAIDAAVQNRTQYIVAVLDKWIELMRAIQKETATP